MDLDFKAFGENLIITDSEESGIEVPIDVWNVDVHDPALTLVGRFLVTRLFNFSVLKSTIVNVMNQGKGMDICQIGNERLLFLFNHPGDRDLILGVVHGFLINFFLRTVESYENPINVNFDWCQFYAHVIGLPFNKISREIATIIGNKIGVFVDVNTDEKGWSSRPTLRMKIQLDLTKPIPHFAKLQSARGEVCGD